MNRMSLSLLACSHDYPSLSLNVCLISSLSPLPLLVRPSVIQAAAAWHVDRRSRKSTLPPPQQAPPQEEEDDSGDNEEEDDDDDGDA